MSAVVPTMTQAPLSPREVRSRVLEIARRRQQPGRGSSREFLRRRTAMRKWPDLTEILREVPWATVGGVAMRHYAPERATVDLDVLIPSNQAEAARERLKQAGFRYEGELTVGNSTWVAPDGTPVDALEADAPWLGEALRQAQQNRDLQGLPVLPMPYFVLMTLRSGRTVDIADITRMLGLADGAVLEEVRATVWQWEPDAIEDIESMILLGRMETRA